MRTVYICVRTLYRISKRSKQHSSIPYLYTFIGCKDLFLSSTDFSSALPSEPKVKGSSRNSVSNNRNKQNCVLPQLENRQACINEWIWIYIWYNTWMLGIDVVHVRRTALKNGWNLNFTCYSSHVFYSKKNLRIHKIN